ncbi:MAG: hypothetical protein U5L01_16265 [Rheinheimera sp.]|nr:hypothetical protein [Rheinheimera sp.]
MKVLIRLLVLLFFTQVRAEPLVLVDSMGLLKAPMQTHPEADMLRQILAIYPDKVQVENISRNRANEWLEKVATPVFHILKKTPEREKHFLFTAPYMAEAALQLIVPANSPWTAKLDLMQRVQPRVSLRELLHLKISPLIGIEINRSYGVEIDKILEENQKHPSLYMRTSSSESVGSLLPMLEKQSYRYGDRIPENCRPQHATVEILSTARSRSHQLGLFCLQQGQKRRNGSE